MERVTDEWLDGLPGVSFDGQSLDRLSFAQAVARECIEVIMCFNDRDEGVRNIRARFGLED